LISLELLIDQIKIPGIFLAMNKISRKILMLRIIKKNSVKKVKNKLLTRRHSIEFYHLLALDCAEKTYTFWKPQNMDD